MHSLPNMFIIEVPEHPNTLAILACCVVHRNASEEECVSQNTGKLGVPFICFLIPNNFPGSSEYCYLLYQKQRPYLRDV